MKAISGIRMRYHKSWSDSNCVYTYHRAQIASYLYIITCLTYVSLTTNTFYIFAPLVLIPRMGAHQYQYQYLPTSQAYPHTSHRYALHQHSGSLKLSVKRRLHIQQASTSTNLTPLPSCIYICEEHCWNVLQPSSERDEYWIWFLGIYSLPDDGGFGQG